jgi:hypothetical protein
LSTFVIAIGKEKDPKKSSGFFSTLSQDDSLPVFPSATIKLDENDQGAYVWAGSGAVVVAGAGSSISFSDASKIATHLAPGDSLYLRITVQPKDRYVSSFL